LLGDPLHEYRRRGRPPVQRYSGAAADIDLVAADLWELDRFPSTGVFQVDTCSFDGRQVQLVEHRDEWRLASPNRRFHAAIDPRVMEPITEEVFGSTCRTIPAQTHLALLTLKDVLRPQDAMAKEILEETLEETGAGTIPSDLYAPFEELSALNTTSRLNRVRSTYRAVVPVAVRKRLGPVVQPVKKSLKLA
jgi:hypothetical protein